MYLTRFVLTALAVALLAGGCATGRARVPLPPESIVLVTPADDRPDPAVAALAPLNVGARWRYRVWLLGEESTREMVITGVKDGWFRFDSGEELAIDRFGLRDRDRYLLRQPLLAGSEWSARTGPSLVETRVIVETGVTAGLAVGRREGCVVVEAAVPGPRGYRLVQRTLFAPGLGMARIETLLVGAGESRRQLLMELVDFRRGVE